MRFEEKYAPVKTVLERDGLYGLGLDIDETLADTNVYWAGLLLEKHGHPDFHDPEEIIQAYRYVRNVPEWQSQRIQAEVDGFIHSDEVVLSIPPVHGAQAGVDAVGRKKPVACYITGRPRKVKDATYKWLHKHGFPNVPVIFQPNNRELEAMGFGNGNQWKAGLLKFLYPAVDGIVDDNKALLRYTDGYEGKIYLLGSDSGNPRVIGCPDWESVVRAV